MATIKDMKIIYLKNLVIFLFLFLNVIILPSPQLMLITY